MIKRVFFGLWMAANALCSIVFASYDSQIYAKSAVVIEVDSDNDEVVCSDHNGNEWVFFGSEDWEVGDICSMVMYRNKTPMILDDVIIKVKYDGHLSGY